MRRIVALTRRAGLITPKYASYNSKSSKNSISQVWAIQRSRFAGSAPPPGPGLRDLPAARAAKSGAQDSTPKADKAESPPASAEGEAEVPSEPIIEVDVSVDGVPLQPKGSISLFSDSDRQLEKLVQELTDDARLVVARALALEPELGLDEYEDDEDGPSLPPEILEILRAEGQLEEEEEEEEEEGEGEDGEDSFDLPPKSVELSLVLCDDDTIRGLNRQFRKKNYATDVLSFPQDEDGSMSGLPIRLLGDLVLSLDTAQRQAAERGHGLRDECRVLLVHGVLHLMGMDHERGLEEAKAMAEAEKSIMDSLGWKGEGLIALAGQGYSVHKLEKKEPAARPKEGKPRGGKPGKAASGDGGTKAPRAQQGLQRDPPAAGPRPAAPPKSRGDPPAASRPRGGDSAPQPSGSSARAGGEGPAKPQGKPQKGPEGASGGPGGPPGGGRGPRGGKKVVASSVVRAAGEEPARGYSTVRMRTSPEIHLVALDMDGTTLNSQSRITQRTARAIKAAIDRGVRVVCCTGKARPATIRALEPVGLTGPGLVAGLENPGIFLQGLAVYGLGGVQLRSSQLDPAVVRVALEYARDRDLPLAAFLGDTIVTAKMYKPLEELSTVYYEPMPDVQSIEQILAGPPVRKLLFMSAPEDVASSHRPHWEAFLSDNRIASLMQAVPDMLEIVPRGIHKGDGLRILQDHLGIPTEAVMAVGDGSNDLPLVLAAGIGVAMGNAVPSVKEAAHAHVASNDEDGVAEALERFVLV